MGVAQRPHRSERRSYVTNAVVNAAANTILAGLGMASGVLAARLLGPHGRGELAAIQTWPGFIGGLAMLGTHDAVAYYSARSPSEAGSYLGSAMVVALTSSLPFMVIGYAAMPWLLHAQASAIVWAGRWYLLVAPVYALVGLPRYPFQGREDFIPWNAMRIAPNVLWIAVLLVAWTSGLATPIFLAGANLVALILLVFPFGVLTVRRIPGPFRPDLEKLPSLLRYGLPCMATMVPQTLNVRLDQMLMAALLPPRDLGLYVVAVAWSGAVAPLLGALSAVTMPAVASAGDHRQSVHRFVTGVQTATALALMLAVALAAITPPAVVILFGAAFRAAIPVALVLVPAAAVLGLNGVLQEGLRGLGRPYAVLQAELAGLLVTAAALAAMLRPMGIMGAALASLLGYSTVTAALLFNARRYAGTSASTLLLPRRAQLRSQLGTLVSIFRWPRGA
jgi:O-antigen/teichoic acid export membrane protein